MIGSGSQGILWEGGEGFQESRGTLGRFVAHRIEVNSGTAVEPHAERNSHVCSANVNDPGAKRFAVEPRRELHVVDENHARQHVSHLVVSERLADA